MHISAAARKPPLVFFLHDRLYFRPLYPVSFPHGERVCERFFIKLTKPSPSSMREFLRSTGSRETSPYPDSASYFAAVP